MNTRTCVCRVLHAPFPVFPPLDTPQRAQRSHRSQRVDVDACRLFVSACLRALRSSARRPSTRLSLPSRLCYSASLLLCLCFYASMLLCFFLLSTGRFISLSLYFLLFFIFYYSAFLAYSSVIKSVSTIIELIFCLLWFFSSILIGMRFAIAIILPLSINFYPCYSFTSISNHSASYENLFQ